MTDFKTIVGQAIGEASMCWSETPGGTFDSSRASLIVDRILEAHHAALGEVYADLDALGEKFDIATEALTFECGNRCAGQNPCNAREALRKIEE